jgi:hypothetical protein
VTEPWTVDEGRVVPATSDIALNNSARRFELATFLYADLNGSTKMVEELGWGRSAEIYKTYLYCASRLISLSNRGQGRQRSPLGRIGAEHSSQAHKSFRVPDLDHGHDLQADRRRSENLF